MKVLALVLATACLVHAQDKASISGTVQDAASGAPVAGIEVHANSAAHAMTDAEGRYQIQGLAPGTYGLQGYAEHGSPTAKKSVTVTSGQEITSVTLTMPSRGVIRGRILDENKEPLPGVFVFLVSTSYSLGQLRHTFVKMEPSNDKGEYTFANIEPHSGYLLMAKKSAHQLDAISDAPADPKLRKKATALTFYPSSPTLEEAQPISVHAGERLEAMDIKLRKMPSYCMEGLLTAAGRAKALEFTIEESAVTSGQFADGGSFVMPPGGTTGADGKLRLCNLARGEYRLTANEMPSSQSDAPPFFGSATISITDRDVRDVRVLANPRVPVAGHVVWDGKAPDPPVEGKVNLWIEPLTRPYWIGEIEALNPKLAVPGDFAIPGMFTDDYRIHLHGLSGDLYVKDVTYADLSILHAPLTIGKSMGNPDLRIVVGHDGGHIQITVNDKDDKPIPDGFVTLVPAEAGSGASLADALVSGQADQNGVFTSGALPPGKYLVLATGIPADPTPDTIDKLWLARSKAKEVEVKANRMSAITIVQLGMD